MSSILSLYQSATACVQLSFTDDAGNGVNLSGAAIYFTAKRNYSDSNADAVINKVVTGDATSVSGQMTMCFTTGETSICTNEYVGGFTAFVGSGVYPFAIDGLIILPSPLGYSP